MEVIIPESNIQTEKTFNLEDLPLASSYAKEAIVIQRKKINEIISSNIEQCNPFIEVPFELFPQIEEEMMRSGWGKSGHEYYQPIWYISPLWQLEKKDEENQIISAKIFYEATMRNQLAVLIEKFEKDKKIGLSSILLDFPLYQAIVDKLELKGWNVSVYHIDENRISKPYTLIGVKQT